MSISEHLDIVEFNFDELLGSTSSQHVAAPKKSKIRRMAERIADVNDLVLEVKQLKDLLRTAGEVDTLYQHEKQQRQQFERKSLELGERCVQLEQKIELEQLNSEQLREQVQQKELPVDGKQLIIIFLQLAQRMDENELASGLQRSERNLMRKLRDHCKSCKINIPAPAAKSCTKKRMKAVAVSTQSTQTVEEWPVAKVVAVSTESTQTIEELPVPKPVPLMCTVGVQTIQVCTRDQGTQHKNMTTTRGTTTASFIKMHSVGTSFPEPKPPPNVHDILNEMLAWNGDSIITPLSPLSEPEPLTSNSSVGTCTDLCNVQRELDFLPELLPTQLKLSGSRPPSRAMYDNIKDEAAFGSAKEFLNFLPHNQSVLTNLPPPLFEEVWQLMGQMVQVVLQRRCNNNNALQPPAPVSQADFGRWFNELYVSTLHEASKAAEFEPIPEETLLEAPPQIAVELAPIKLPLKPKFSLKRQPKIKVKPRKRSILRCKVKRPKPETAVHFLSNLKLNCDKVPIELNAEEQQLLELTKANKVAPSVQQPAIAVEEATTGAVEEATTQVVEEATRAVEKEATPAETATEETPAVTAKDVTPVAIAMESMPTPSAFDSDADSDCDNLVIDVGEQYTASEQLEEEPPQPQSSPIGTKRKRKVSTNSQTELQPQQKRLTRLQVKLQQQTQIEISNTPTAVSTEAINCVDYEQPRDQLFAFSPLQQQTNDCYLESPASPVASELPIEDEPIEIPLEAPYATKGRSANKAILPYLIVRHKAKPKKQTKQTQQVRLDINNYLKDAALLRLEPNVAETPQLMETWLTVYAEMQDEAAAMTRLLAVFTERSGNFRAQLMAKLEQLLFNQKQRCNTQLALRYLHLYLQLIQLQSNQLPNYVNPARLLLAKLMYHYNHDMPLLVLEVLRQFPTVLPHREQREYDHSDALITVIKHLLMCHKYEVSQALSAERALLSKLRFEYHFQPFEPTKLQVLENLLDKLKAGRLEQLSYAFALFCRRMSTNYVLQEVLAAQLMPLINNYCDLCTQSSEFELRLMCLLQCVSMIVKQLPLDSKPDIPRYIEHFKRVLLALPRPNVQQAALQALLRMQRFGYAFVLNALQGFKPNYDLTPLTRAMLRCFVNRRAQSLPRLKSKKKLKLYINNA
ncbi:Ice1 [Drosophila busckii]|uniref:Ice1 n=1 Tax=Drosophila busckii TaxID=30019 RepID=A0A0M4EVM9_DROBS|nr:little elongation complex subunit 1 [Drosophila busckii]ALC41707.1 Ice1 [Drosophila busckii]